jgi:histidinol-phosphate aminotransferase
MSAPERLIPETPVEGSTVRPRGALGKLPRYAAGKPPAAAQGLQSYKLSSNENPLPPLPAVLQAIARETEVNRYPNPSAAELRQELAGFLDVPAEDIVTGAGSLGALNQILAAFAGQDEHGVADQVIYAWRSFEAYPISVGLAGAEAVEVPLAPDGTHDLAAMAAAVTDRTRVILLCTPNNPTGPALTTHQVEEFLARVPRRVVVVIDEAYQEFVRHADAVDGISVYREHTNVAVLRTFSKAHGLAGLRVGYSVAQPSLTEHLRLSAVPFAVSQIAERAAIASLRNHAEVLDRVQSIVEERQQVKAGLASLGWSVPDAQGNFIWLELRSDTAHFAAMAEKAGLSVRAFGSEGVRVTIGEPEANLRLLEVCGLFGQEYGGPVSP